MELKIGDRVRVGRVGNFITWNGLPVACFGSACGWVNVSVLTKLPDDAAEQRSALAAEERERAEMYDIPPVCQ